MKIKYLISAIACSLSVFISPSLIVGEKKALADYSFDGKNYIFFEKKKALSFDEGCELIESQLSLSAHVVRQNRQLVKSEEYIGDKKADFSFLDASRSTMISSISHHIFVKTLNETEFFAEINADDELRDIWVVFSYIDYKKESNVEALKNTHPEFMNVITENNQVYVSYSCVNHRMDFLYEDGRLVGVLLDFQQQ
jgi:hypothetical protein